MASLTKPCKNKDCTKSIPKGLNPYCSFACAPKKTYTSSSFTNKRRSVALRGSTPVKKKKTISKQKRISKVRSKADSTASKYYRSITPYCQAKGRDDKECNGNLQWCHIMSRRYKAIRYHAENHLIMCAGHHQKYTYHVEEWMVFIEKHYNEKFRFVSANWNNEHKESEEYYQEWLDYFSV